MTTRIIKIVLSLVCAGMLASCVEHRPVRNGLRNESVYLDKVALLQTPEVHEDYWLHKITVVKASSPNVVGNYAFPGFESALSMVQFRFKENALQVLDARQLQPDSPDNPNDDTATRAERVLFEFQGAHVDTKLRESLDGERTNFLEENYEQSWQDRQQFKVDFESSNVSPVASIAWYYGEFLHQCARPLSVNLLPDSYDFEKNRDGGDIGQHLSFVLEVNYSLNLQGGCWDMVSLLTNTGTATIEYRISFFRPEVPQSGPNTFEVQHIAEKDPARKKYGAFEHLNIFRDPESGLLDARSVLHRWNPKRPSDDPVIFYFHKGFPPRFKPMFDEIKAQTNRVMESAGATLRFDFREFNDGGVERHLGDIRYSFVTWHQDIDTTRGLLGYGPSSANPITGELISASLNLYNIGMDWYRFLIQDYLESFGALAADEGGQPWEDTTCEEGTTRAPATTGNRLQSGLFKEMRRTMNLPEPAADEDPRSLFIPEPSRGQDAFQAEYLRTLPEYRYVRPEWNNYVWRTGSMPMEKFADRLAVDKQFDDSMHEIMMNENPFGHTNLHGREGIEAMNEFVENFRGWRQNHDELESDREMLLGSKNIYVFDEMDAISAISKGARRCVAREGGTFTWESNEAYQERIIEDVVFHVALHEFGHNLSLRHNFYGSVDAEHMHPGGMSSSVMDYVKSHEEVGAPRIWGQYDEAALKWIYGNESMRAEMMQEDFLYCTDEHRSRSPLCRAHDLGITPSQIVLNSIERYDWLYEIRNRRAYRTFWDTSRYNYSTFRSLFSLQRMWHLGIFDWSGGGVQSVLKRLDQVDPERAIKSDQEYDEISVDFYNDMSAAVDLTMSFYDAIINQPATSRNYQTEFDPYYGDVIRLGIILDKLYAAFAFMDMQPIYNYNPNVRTYMAMYDAPFGSQNYALSQRVLDNMLGSNYDIFPWFRYLAVNLYAWATNSNLIRGTHLKERIAIRRFESLARFVEVFGEDAYEEATQAFNPTQLFIYEGEQYVYTYLEDRGWHLVAGKSRSPVSFQYIKDYNDSLNGSASGSLDNFGLKILLSYYEYYDNFAGF